jgi:DNA-binding CsgD family transcriptional regulator
MAARVHLAAGRLGEAVAEANTTLAVAADTVAIVAPLAEWILATAALLKGDLGAADRHVKRYEAARPPAEKQYYSAPLDFTAGWIASARGDVQGAEAIFAPMYANPPEHRLLLAVEPTAAPFLVRNAVRHGDRQRAEGIVIEAGRVAAASPDIGSLAAADAHARGVAEQDAALLDDAAARHRHPWARASALEDSGMVLLTSDTPAARVRFQRALDGYEDIGARRGADRVRGRIAGLRGDVGEEGRKPVAGWASLTETDRQVSALVAEGLTNLQVADRMTLSRHTVDSHLRQIFRKLNINSRVELTRIALEREGE